MADPENLKGSYRISYFLPWYSNQLCSLSSWPSQGVGARYPSAALTRCSCKLRLCCWRRFLWGRTGSCLGRDSEEVFTLSPSPWGLSEPWCGYPCAQPGTPLLLPCWSGDLGCPRPPQHPLGSGAQQFCVAGRDCHPLPLSSLTQQPAMPGRAMGWAAQHTQI